MTKAIEDTEFRLPRGVAPRRYELRFRPDLPAATFSGHARIEIEVAHPTNEIVCNAAELEIQKALLHTAGSDDAPLPVAVTFDEEEERVTFSLADEIAEGKYVLELDFSGVLNDMLRGFYRSTFKDDAGDEHVIATTQFEATDARRAFPCWDEPDRKAVFSITLEVRKELTAVSNGPVVSDEEIDGGYRRVRFGDTIPMSTYIVAFVVGPLEISETVDVDGIPLRVIHTPGKGHLTRFALDAGAHALRFFAEWFDIPYPGEKLDLVAIPDFAAGAMENLGCVTFREVEVLVDTADAAFTELERIAEVIEHEIAHMWFGDLVTMKWWNGIWLNEAFATFMSVLCLDDFKPEWNRWVGFARSKNMAMQIDSLHATRPIEYPVRRPEDADGMFDLLTYEKGASVLRMVERYLGAERFRDGVRRYLKQHIHGNTETTDLWDAIEAEAGDEPIRAIMDSWIFQGGYPLVCVAAGEQGDLYVSEEPFSLLRTAAEAADDTDRPGAFQAGPFAPDHGGIGSDWLVPLIVGLRTDGVPSESGALPERAAGAQRIVLTGNGATVDLDGGATEPGAFALANIGGHGFYRVRYDNDLFTSVVRNLHRLERLERFALVSDTWACALAGALPLEDFIRLVDKLGDETDPNVWAIVLGAIGRLDRAIHDHHRPQLREWTVALLQPQLERIGWEPATGEDPQVPMFRSSLVHTLGTIAEEASVRARCFELFAGARNGRPIDADLTRSVLGVVLQTGGKEEFEAIRDRYRKSSSPLDEERHLESLAEVRDAGLATEVHEMCLSEIRTQDAPYMLARMLLNRHVRGLTWDFVREHYTEMESRYPKNSIPRMLSGVTGLDEVGDAGDTPLADSARDFVATHTFPGVQKLVDQQIELLDVGIAFIRRERPRLGSLLEQD